MEQPDDTTFKVAIATSNGWSTLDLEWLRFPGGELHVRIKDLPIAGTAEYLAIDARMCQPGDVVALMLLVDALRRVFLQAPIDLVLLYVPYARQDRVEIIGEPLSIAVFAGLINSLKFREVSILDPHSNVTPALIDRVRQHHVVFRVRKAVEIIDQLWPRDDSYDLALVSPDAGAEKRVATMAHELRLGLVQATKHRDPVTGRLSDIRIVSGDCKRTRYLIVDDICDGGGTFTLLAEKLRERAPPDAKVGLYVSHGIFSKGMRLDGIDEIFVANMLNREPRAPGIHSVR